jgi:DNA-binding NtrC family response regulator
MALTFPSQNEPQRILVVEDAADIRRLLVLLLTRAGYEVSGAGTKAEALKLYAKNNFDLLFSDISLPDGSGLDLMREMVAIRPIIAISYSGYDSGAGADGSPAAGYAAHLLKPAGMGEILSTVARVLRSLPANASREIPDTRGMIAILKTLTTAAA